MDLLETAIMAKKTQYVPPEPPAVAVTPENLAVAVSAKELFSTPRPTVNLETGEPEEPTPPNDYETENVLADAAMYEAVGLGLSKKEMYGVMLCAKKLGENPDFGVLTAPVSAYPPFPGTEAHYLRALVGRIASATVVCPVGYFAVSEEDGSLSKDEEFVPKEPAEMADLTAWAHRYPHIKEQGRCEFYQFPVPEPEEGEEPPEAPEPETGPELLQTLDLDAESTAADWGAAVTTPAPAPEGDEPLGEPTVEPKPAWAPCASSNVPGVKYQVVGMKSLVWPGAFVAYAGGRFSNCYVGYGFQNKKFVPAPPPAVEPEFDLVRV